MIGSALVAVFFYAFLIGLFINRSSESIHSGNDFLLENIIKSLYLSWLIVFLSFLFNLPNLLFILFGLLILKLVLRPPRISLNIMWVELLLLVVLFGGSIIYLLPEYTLAFIKWDAVVSWNRWAIELSKNDLHPVNNIYPVFLPAFWSLIYKAMGTSDYVAIAKSSLFITPLLLILVSIKAMIKNWITGILITVTSLYIIVFCISGDLLTGYMDGPVAALILVELMILVMLTPRQKDQKIDIHSIYVLGMLFGITSIVKQPGIMVLIILYVWLCMMCIKRYLKIKEVLFTVLISIIPFLTFLYMYFLQSNTWFGNLSTLKGLVETRSEGNIFVNAYNLLSDFFGWYVIIPLFILSFANFFFIKRCTGQLGILIFIVFLIGFYVYTDCCSYHVRNGWWLISLLVAGAFAFLLSLNRSYD